MFARALEFTRKNGPTFAVEALVNFILPYANGLDEDEILSGRIHQLGHIRSRVSQPARAATRRHRADKNPRIGMVLLHSDAVAQKSSTGAATRRIDRNYAYRLSLASKSRGQRVHKCTLACTRRPGDSNDAGVAGKWRQLTQNPDGVRVAVLDCCCGPRKSKRIPLADFGGPIVH